MKNKFIKQLESYEYILAFDLASKNTGVCVWEIKHNKPLFTTTIKVFKDAELPSADLKEKLEAFILSLQKQHHLDIDKILVIKEAMPTQLRGASSTIQTFVALARSHAILDTVLYTHKIPTYDYVGIYPITWHNYFKKVMKADKDFKVDKQVVYEYNIKEYNLHDNLTLDESDAIFMCKTFIEIKWNNDIDEQIREIKRHKKILKAPHAIKVMDEEIVRLQQLKYHPDKK